jgi:hypothetical protein
MMETNRFYYICLRITIAFVMLACGKKVHTKNINMTDYKILFENKDYVTVESLYEIITYDKVGGGSTGGFKGVVDADFIEKRQIYINAFQNYWQLPDSLLDYSTTSLEIIDNIIIKGQEDKTKWAYIPFSKISSGRIHLLTIPKEAMYGIVAYVGEVIIKEANGYWYVKEEDHTVTIDIKQKFMPPLILGSNGFEFDTEANEHLNLKEENYTITTGIKYKLKQPIVIGRNGFEFDFAYMVVGFFYIGDDFLVAPRVGAMLTDAKRKR